MYITIDEEEVYLGIEDIVCNADIDIDEKEELYSILRRELSDSDRDFVVTYLKNLHLSDLKRVLCDVLNVHYHNKAGLQEALDSVIECY